MLRRQVFIFSLALFVYALFNVTAMAETGVTLGSIGMVATSVEARRRGIGRAAVLAALEWFRQHGVEAVDAGAQSQNLPAARLYERCGFQLADISLTFRKLMQRREQHSGELT